MDKITAKTVRALLHKRYEDHRRYAVAEEVGNATGLEQTRRLDMVVVDCYKSNDYCLEGIEVKVSKADLRKELRDRAKHNIFFKNLDYYSLAAPASIVDEETIPKHWGLYLIDQYPNEDQPHLRVYRNPLSLHDKQRKTLDRSFAVCLMRALQKQSPTAAELERARQKGMEEARRWENQSSDRREIERLKEELEAFSVFRERCGIWGGGSVERGIARFEEFKNLRLECLERDLRNIVTSASNALAVFDAAVKDQ